jgi:hypothetical protein
VTATQCFGPLLENIERQRSGLFPGSHYRNAVTPGNQVDLDSIDWLNFCVGLH